MNNKCFLFDNPINQNYGHKKIVEDLLSSSVFIESIIVFINRCNLKVETKSKVLYDYQIVNYINNKKKILSEDKINEIYNLLMENKITDEEKIKNHDYNVRMYMEYKNKIANLGKCPRCGANLILRKGKNGSFFGCYNYPKCKYTKEL